MNYCGNRSALKTLGILSLVGLVCFSAGAQARDDMEESLAVLEGEIATLVEKSESLLAQIAPGKGFLTEEEGLKRYYEYVYLHLIGEHEAAAEGFFALVTTAVLENAGLHWDAEWYLAESLFQLGNLLSAEQSFQVIVDTVDHPFHDDAVRRLLALYVASKDTARFYQLYQREIVSGNVAPSDSITYSVGKAFFNQGDFLHAKTELENIKETSSWYRKALYIRGAIAVSEQDFEYGVQVFDNLVALPVAKIEDRQLHDLSRLALGRISMELGEFEKAAAHYDRIEGDSFYQADKLYEQVWAIIKQKNEIREQRLEDGDELSEDDRIRLDMRERDLVQQALRGVEIFRLAYPEHEYTAQLKLLQGHLHLQAVEYDEALASYEQVIASYTPIRTRFARLAMSEEKPGEYFAKLLEMSDPQIAETEKLPAYAMNMVMADKELGRAITVYKDLAHQERNLKVSEKIITELEEVFGASEGIGGFETIWYNVSFNSTLARQKQLDLLGVESEFIASSLPAADKRDAQQLRLRLDEVAKDSIEAKSALEIERVLEATDQLRAQFKALRRDVKQTDASIVFARIDGNYTSLEHASSLLEKVREDFEALESNEMDRMRQRFQHEVDEVARQRDLLSATLSEAEAVSIDLTRSGFGRLEDFFAESLLRADVGIIDVYWAQKVEVSEEKTRILEERKTLRDEIERRFALIEQKMRQ